MPPHLEKADHHLVFFVIERERVDSPSARYEMFSIIGKAEKLKIPLHVPGVSLLTASSVPLCLRYGDRLGREVRGGFEVFIRRCYGFGHDLSLIRVEKNGFMTDHPRINASGTHYC